jgi:Putative beta-barrel porin 2
MPRIRMALVWSALVSAALIVGTIPSAFAQFGQEIAPVGQYKAGIPVGLWTVFPSIFAGGVYDDNTSQLTGHNSGTSGRLVPNLSAVWNTQNHQTTLYGIADAQFFDTNTVSATTGFSHSYEPTRDLILNIQSNYTRQTDIFTSALNFNNGAIGPTTAPGSSAPLFINPFGTTPSVNPTAYNQFTAAGYVTKKFGADDRAFVSLSGAAYYLLFDHQDDVGPNNPFQTTHDGANYQVSASIGYHIARPFYIFADGGGIFQRFQNSLFNTDGYRVTGGIGADDPKSLLTGQIYGGYQEQREFNNQLLTFPGGGVPGGIPGPIPGVGVASGIPENTGSSVFGGRLYYFPTRQWTLAAQVDEVLGIATILEPTVPAGTPSRTISSLMQSNYSLWRELTVGVRAGYTRTTFIGIDRTDNGYMAGASLNYEIWRNLRATLDYQYMTGRSTAPMSDFTRNVYTAGITYRY